MPGALLALFVTTCLVVTTQAEPPLNVGLGDLGIGSSSGGYSSSSGASSSLTSGLDSSYGIPSAPPLGGGYGESNGEEVIATPAVKGVRYAGPIVYTNEKPPVIHFPPPPKPKKGGWHGKGGKGGKPRTIKYVPLPHHDLPILIYQSDIRPPIHVVSPPPGAVLDSGPGISYGAPSGGSSSFSSAPADSYGPPADSYGAPKENTIQTTSYISSAVSSPSDSYGAPSSDPSFISSGSLATSHSGGLAVPTESKPLEALPPLVMSSGSLTHTAPHPERRSVNSIQVSRRDAQAVDVSSKRALDLNADLEAVESGNQPTYISTGSLTESLLSAPAEYGAPSADYGAPSSSPSAQYGAPSAPSADYGAPSSAPSAQYGPPASDPSAQYGSPSSAPSAQYGSPSSDPSAQYGSPSSAPSAQYGSPASAQYSSLSSQYGAPSSLSSQYGAPSSSSSQYGAPSAPSSDYSIPASAPSGQYGAPNSVSSQYGAPNSVSSQYGAPNSVSSQYGAPNSVSSQYGAPNSVSSQYGAPSILSSQYGAPSGSISGFSSSPSILSSSYGLPKGSSFKSSGGFSKGDAGIPSFKGGYSSLKSVSYGPPPKKAQLPHIIYTGHPPIHIFQQPPIYMSAPPSKAQYGPPPKAQYGPPPKGLSFGSHKSANTIKTVKISFGPPGGDYGFKSSGSSSSILSSNGGWSSGSGLKSSGSSSSILSSNGGWSSGSGLKSSGSGSNIYSSGGGWSSGNGFKSSSFKSSHGGQKSHKGHGKSALSQIHSHISNSISNFHSNLKSLHSLHSIHSSSSQFKYGPPPHKAKSSPKYVVAPKAWAKPPIIIYQGVRPPVTVYEKPSGGYSSSYSLPSTLSSDGYSSSSVTTISQPSPVAVFGPITTTHSASPIALAPASSHIQADSGSLDHAHVAGTDLPGNPAAQSVDLTYGISRSSAEPGKLIDTNGQLSQFVAAGRTIYLPAYTTASAAPPTVLVPTDKIAAKSSEENPAALYVSDLTSAGQQFTVLRRSDALEQSILSEISALKNDAKEAEKASSTETGSIAPSVPAPVTVRSESQIQVVPSFVGTNEKTLNGIPASYSSVILPAAGAGDVVATPVALSA